MSAACAAWAAVRDWRGTGDGGHRVLPGTTELLLCCAAGGVGWTGRATAAAPPPAPSWFGLFAVRHPSDSSCHEDSLPPHSPLGAGPLPLRSLNVSDNAELLAAAQVALNRHADVLRDLGTAVRRRGPRAVSGRRQRARCVARPARHRPRLHHRRPARADAAHPAAVGRRAVGHRHRVRHRRRRQGATSAWRSPRSAPTPTTRCRATRRCGSATASTTIWSAATSPPTRWRCASRPTVPANSSIP